MERALERDARSSENGAPLDAPSYVYFFAALVDLVLLVLLRAPLREAVFLFFTRAIVVWTKLPRTTLSGNNHHRSAAIWTDFIGLLELSTSRQRIAGLALLVVGAANKNAYPCALTYELPDPHACHLPYRLGTRPQ